MITLRGKDLRVGDTVEVWWSPRRDTITALRPYTGPLKCFKHGARIADFAISRTGMTIDGGEDFVVLSRIGGST